MWPFKKKSVVSDSTSIEHVKKELPSEYLAQVIENKPSEPHDKLTKVLTALMKEDPKLTDRLLGFPDTEVQEIALHNMK